MRRNAAELQLQGLAEPWRRGFQAFLGFGDVLVAGGWWLMSFWVVPKTPKVLEVDAVGHWRTGIVF